MDDGSCDCVSGKGTFSVQKGVAQTIIGVTNMQQTATKAVPILSAASSTASTASPSSSGALSSSAASSTSIYMNTASSSANPTASTSASASGTPHNNHRNVIIGLMVGLGFPILAGLAVVLYKRRYKDRRSRKRLDGSSEAMHQHREASPVSTVRNLAAVEQPRAAPHPDPYLQSFPTDLNLAAQGGTLPRNRTPRMELTPDNDTQRGRPYYYSQYPPPLDPYGVSPPQSPDNPFRRS